MQNTCYNYLEDAFMKEHKKYHMQTRITAELAHIFLKQTKQNKKEFILLGDNAYPMIPLFNTTK